jgi:hypothetical protein
MPGSGAGLRQAGQGFGEKARRRGERAGEGASPPAGAATCSTSARARRPSGEAADRRKAQAERVAGEQEAGGFAAGLEAGAAADAAEFR